VHWRWPHEHGKAAATEMETSGGGTQSPKRAWHRRLIGSGHGSSSKPSTRYRALLYLLVNRQIWVGCTHQPYAPYIRRFGHITDEYRPHIFIGDGAAPMNIWVGSKFLSKMALNSLDAHRLHFQSLASRSFIN
jgi:hypothetical protein